MSRFSLQAKTRSRYLYICLLMTPVYLAPTIAAPQYKVQVITNELPTLDWESWDTTEFDVDSLPLTSTQKEIIKDKLTLLKQELGVGIIGDIELAISQLDESNLLNEPMPTFSENLLLSTLNTPTFHDDLLLEEEILALEFANRTQQNDPEGLTVENEQNRTLFVKLMEKLEKLKIKKSAEKTPKNNRKERSNEE